MPPNTSHVLLCQSESVFLTEKGWHQWAVIFAVIPIVLCALLLFFLRVFINASGSFLGALIGPESARWLSVHSNRCKARISSEQQSCKFVASLHRPAKACDCMSFLVAQ